MTVSSPSRWAAFVRWFERHNTFLFCYLFLLELLVALFVPLDWVLRIVLVFGVLYIGGYLYLIYPGWDK